MAFLKLAGWARPISKATKQPISATWHAFSQYWAHDPHPTSLCGQPFEAIGPVRSLSTVAGEVCHRCRAQVDQHNRDVGAR
jgi:hypothetical protein